MTAWITLLNVVTGISEVFLKLSPTPDIYTVHRSRSIGEVAELPIITMTMSCHLWTLYAFATDNMFPLFATQLFGEVVSVLYNTVYFHWSPADKRQRLLKLYAVAFAAWSVATLYLVLGLAGVFGQTKSQVGTALGYVSSAFSLSMFSSPLATLRHVVATKNGASIPINMCAMVFEATVLWTVLGVALDDLFVAVTNGLGVVLSCSQIVIYLMYRPKQQNPEETPNSRKEVTLMVFSPEDKPQSTVLVDSPSYRPMPSPLLAAAT